MGLDDNAFIYINRLSDYFFLLARKLNKVAGKEDVTLWGMSIVTGFAEKMDKLISYDQILLEDSRYIGITEDEIERYIAYKIQRFMNKYVINPKKLHLL